MTLHCSDNNTKLEIPENFEEEENSDDNEIDDDVFIRDRRNGYRMDVDGAKKPLMARRKKPMRNGKLYTEIHPSPPLRVICAPITYGIISLAALLGLIALVVVLIKYFASPLSILAFWKQSTLSPQIFLPCTHIKVEDVWVRNFPKLLTESAFRMLDLNQDGVKDVVLGFGTGADGYQIPKFVCDIYFERHHPCLGGVLALEGKTGDVIWQHWSEHEIFALNCNSDFNGDGINDCLAGGRTGVFECVSGKDGSLVWSFNKDNTGRNEIMNIYTAQVIPDFDGDEILDVLAVYGGDPLADPGSEYRLSGRLLLLSGKDGHVISWVGTPDSQESYYSPQLLIHPDGTQLVLFGTGGETHRGSLYVLKLDDLYKGHVNKAHAIYTDNSKGIMVPPVLVDLNEDGTPDIVMSMFNSTVIAFDGFNFKQLWNYTFDGSETYSTPAVGFFDSDEKPDFLVKYSYGPGFPQYFYAQTTVLSGRTGLPLLPNPIQQTVASQASPLTINFDGKGNDVFLFWTADCEGYVGKENEFVFSKGSNVHEQSRSDLCRIRFDTNLQNRIYALSSGMDAPGVVIYDSELKRVVEYNNTVNTSAMGQEYLSKHPELSYIYNRYEHNNEEILGQQSGLNTWDGEEEMTENIRYPSSHNIRKQGKLAKIPENWQRIDEGMSSNTLFDPLPMSLDEEDTDEDTGRWTRRKRHIGPHDNGGVQRLISTGTLAPPLSPSLDNHTIDYVFATYWFFPSKTQAILPKQRDCIQTEMAMEQKRRSDPNSIYSGLDHNQYEQLITDKCIEKQSNSQNSGIFESQDSYNPFQIKMGQMTVYRVSLTFSRHENGFNETSDGVQCSQVLPWEKQHWAAYMGTRGDSYFHANNEN